MEEQKENIGGESWKVVEPPCVVGWSCLKTKIAQHICEFVDWTGCLQFVLDGAVLWDNGHLTGGESARVWTSKRCFVYGTAFESESFRTTVYAQVEYDNAGSSSFQDIDVEFLDHICA